MNRLGISFDDRLDALLMRLARLPVIRAVLCRLYGHHNHMDLDGCSRCKRSLGPTVLCKCPKCGAAPFDQFLPGQFTRFGWFGMRAETLAVICRACKEIVSYERRDE